MKRVPNKRVYSSLIGLFFVMLMLQSNLAAAQQSFFAIINKNDTSDEVLGNKNRFSSLDPFQALADLGINPQNATNADYNILGKLRDNLNDYHQVWTPWLTRAAVHDVEVSEDGEFLVIGGGYLLDTELHIYRWNPDERQYVKVWEAGSGLLTRDVYDVAFGDTDGNGLIEIAAACADGRVYLFEQAHIIDPIANLENRFDFVWKSDNFFQVSSVEFEDLDLDGEQDLIIGSWDKKVHIFEYTDHSGYPFAVEHWITLTERWVSPALDSQVQSLGVGDFNHNGLPDFIIGTFSGSVYVFENDGTIITTPTGDFPFPNDNNYRHLWDTSGEYRPIWRPVLKIATGDLGDHEGTQAIILVPGQGTWILSYTDERGFFLEQLIKPFEDWQLNEPYPLDYYADWMVREDGTSWNVFHQLSNGSWVEEPSFVELAINENTGAMGPPNGRYSVFRTNSTETNATGTWNFGSGEELASNGNEDPDLFIVMGDSLATFNKSEWNISLSNDLNSWYQINQTEITITTGTNGSAFAIDVDPLFAVKKMTSARYVRMTLLGEGQTKDRYLDGFILPYVARPVIAASVTISQLPFSYYNPESASQKIILGGTDGRLMAYHYEPQTELIGQYMIWTGKWEFENLYTNYTDEYNMTLSQFSQVWDSFTDDFFNLGTTIWSIQETPKNAFIPSWRYIHGSSATPEFSSFTSSNLLHHLSMAELDSNSAGEEFIVSYRNSDSLYLRSSVTGAFLTSTNTIFGGVGGINNYADFNGKILTSTLAELISTYGETELITFPWYQDFTRPTGYDATLMPVIWRFDGVRYVVHSILDDVDLNLYTFLSDSNTYPSAAAGDLNGDGLTDIVISNGRLVMLWNIGNATNPKFKLDTEYFDELNEGLPVQAVFSPQLWDYDQDGDYDIAFSYGRVGDAIRYGMDLFENIRTATSPQWMRNTKIMQNPSIEGSFRFNNYTAGIVIPSDSLTNSAEGLWIYNVFQDTLRYLQAEVGVQTSFMIGTNPELLKLEVNKLQSPYGSPPSINMGFSLAKSWSNLQELEDWTLTLGVSYGLDGDNNSEIIVSDYDNNVYVFEHLTENIYKRAYKTFDLNHTVITDYSPYDLPGISGSFQRTFYDHGNLIATGLDYDNDGNEAFIVSAGLSVYVFEATGFNDEFIFAYGKDYTGIINDTTLTQFTTLAVTSDLDGRGAMIALGVSNKLFLIRYDPQLGWLESLYPIEGGEGFYIRPGDPEQFPDLQIRTLLFADLNQDKKTELWVGGNKESAPDEGFFMALESGYGNISQIYEFPQFNVRINSFATTDSDYDGNLELIIAHAYGLDIWEVKKGSGFDLTRIETISSDPTYGIVVSPTPVFGTYQSATGLAPRSHDILRLNTGDYFMAYGVETENHDPFSGLELYQNWTTGDGLLYYNLDPDPTEGGTIMQNSLFSYEAKPILINEILYEYWNGSTLQDNVTWIELYNPNNFPINLTGYTLANESATFVTLSGLIAAGGYYIVAQNATAFQDLYPGVTVDDEWGSYTLNRFGDTLNLRDPGVAIQDTVAWGNVPDWNVAASNATLQRRSRLDLYSIRRPQDTDSVADWYNSTTIGTPRVEGPEAHQAYQLPWHFEHQIANYNTSAVNITYGVEYQPSITQLKDGSIFIAWLAMYYGSAWYNDTTTPSISTLYTKKTICILGRRFASDGTPLTNTVVIALFEAGDHTTSTYLNSQYTGLSVTTVNNTIILAYVIDAYDNAFNGDIGIMQINPDYINDTDYFIPYIDKTSFLTDTGNFSLGEYFIDSVGISTLNDYQAALVFSGFIRNSYAPQNEIYYSIVNASNCVSLERTQMTDGSGEKKHPSIRVMADYPDRISVLYEKIMGGKSELYSVFSRDAGLSWTESYALETDDPNLSMQNGTLKTGVGADVFARQLYRPRVTDDGTGGIIYQYMARFLIAAGTDGNYTGNLYDYYGTSYTLATNLWVANISYGDWFKFDDILDVRMVATGDSDNDLRGELLLSHGYRVSLLEISQDATGRLSHTQVWQYQPSLFLSQYPEQVNSSLIEYLVSGTERYRETGAVAIFDANGNGWPELIFSVRGGDVFAFEITDLTQPINDKVFLTQKIQQTNATLTANITHLLITEVLYEPPNNNFDQRWIEIYNPTDSNVNLDNWQIVTTSGSPDPTFTLSGVLNAGEYLLIVQDITEFQILYPGVIPDLEWGTGNFGMNIAGDTLILKNPSGIVIDSVSWEDWIPGWSIGAVSTTLRRINLVDTNSVIDWEDTGTLGDPGTSSIYGTTPEASDNLLVDVNGDGLLDLVVADNRYGNGIVAWNLSNDSLIWHHPIPGINSRVHFVNNSGDGEPLVLAVTSEGVFGVNLNGTRRYGILGTALNTSNNHVLVDINADSLLDLIVATTENIRAINIANGEDIWTNVSMPDPGTSGYFDLTYTKFGNNTVLAVSSSDFATYKKIFFLNSTGGVLESLDMTQYSALDSNSKSVLADFNENNQLDIAIINCNSLGKAQLLVFDIVSKDPIFNETVPLPLDFDFTHFSIYCRDVDNDSLKDIILPISAFSSIPDASFFPDKGYTSAVFAINIASSTIVWNRYFTDTLTNFESINYDNGEIFVASTANFGVFGLAQSGEDILWAEANPELVTVSIAAEETTGTTFIATTNINGNGLISAVIGTLAAAENIITPKPYIVNTHTAILYTKPASVNLSVIPVRMSVDGTENLLIAFSNGTLVLRSFYKGELWKMQLDPFSTITASGLEIQPGQYGLAFTNTTNLFVIQEITNLTWIEVETTASIVASISLNGQSDVLLLQRIVGNSGTLSIFDPTTATMIWNYTSAHYFTELSVRGFDPTNPGTLTHIVALDYLGTASLIELPSTVVGGGTFAPPTIGTKWTMVKTLENAAQLADVFLLSDGGELKCYKWHANGAITSISADTGLTEVMSIDVAYQGVNTDILLNTRYNGSFIFRSDGSTIAKLVELRNNYFDSYAHMYSNIDNSGVEEVVIALGNSLVIMTPEGTVSETHSFTSDIVYLMSWTADTSHKPVILAILKSGSVGIADPSMRPLIVEGSYEGSILYIDLRVQTSTGSIYEPQVVFAGGQIIQGIFTPLMVVMVLLLAYVKKHRRANEISKRRI
ncbi:MAG: lamin tail domain-containing protein [Candidatus Hermodarchaeota archaeon]